jgi:hypothetical protein
MTVGIGKLRAIFCGVIIITEFINMYPTALAFKNADGQREREGKKQIHLP